MYQARKLLSGWEKKGWKIDSDAGEASGKTAYAIPSPLRKKQTGWVIDEIRPVDCIMNNHENIFQCCYASSMTLADDEIKQYSLQEPIVDWAGVHEAVLERLDCNRNCQKARKGKI